MAFFKVAILFVALWASQVGADCVPKNGCRAVAWYRVVLGDQLNDIYLRFGVNLEQLREFNSIPNQDSVEAGKVLYVPFDCSCSGGVLGHTFVYDQVKQNDSLQTIIGTYYQNLSNQAAVAAANPTGIIVYPSKPVNIPVNCSCGSPRYPSHGLFATYPVQAGDTAETLAANFSTTRSNLTAYNPSVNFDRLALNTILFVPAKYANGSFPPFRGDSGTSKSNAAAIGGSVAGVAALLLVAAAVLWCLRSSRKKKRRSKLQYANRLGSPLGRTSIGSGQELLYRDGTNGAVDKSVEFSYEELAAATDNFSIANKIGQGGYGSVYYGELRDQKLAIKMMNLQASREFLSELKVLTRVHHSNLVQLIGYCTGDYLFLVYEYVDNGTLAHHLRGRDVPPLSWSRRVQIALDAARGLEYIHEHTKPTYIHRDVKSPNILIDKNYRAKVADFGLTKLTESTPAGAGSLPTRLAGTFGYMPPEYARLGEVSPKIDVYSFGVVLYEIVSAKDAIVRDMEEDETDLNRMLPRGLVTIFDSVLKGPNPVESLKSIIDPRLGTDHPFDSVWKVTKLAEACTHEYPENRPSMRTVVVSLMTLCNTTQELDASSYPGPLVSGR